MFKPKKKLNENAVKKDFFKIKKSIKDSEKINLISKVNETIFLTSNDLEKISLPKEKQTLFLRTKKARSIVNFILKINPKETYLFCSRLNKKSFDILKEKNLKGIGLSERVLQNNPEFYKEVKNQIKVKLNNNHAKILLFQIENDYYIVSGSGNASINSRIENYVIENSQEKYQQIKLFFENA